MWELRPKWWERTGLGEKCSRQRKSIQGLGGIPGLKVQETTCEWGQVWQIWFREGSRSWLCKCGGGERWRVSIMTWNQLQQQGLFFLTFIPEFFQEIATGHHLKGLFDCFSPYLPTGEEWGHFALTKNGIPTLWYRCQYYGGEQVDWNGARVGYIWFISMLILLDSSDTTSGWDYHFLWEE